MIGTAVKEKGTQQTGLPLTGAKRRLLRFLFNPPPVGRIPPAWVASELAGVAVFNRCANRLARHPVDLVTHLGMVRANAYYAAGCPLELCEHAAARDLWAVIHQDIVGEREVQHGIAV